MKWYFFIPIVNLFFYNEFIIYTINTKKLIISYLFLVLLNSIIFSVLFALLIYLCTH